MTRGALVLDLVPGLAASDTFRSREKAQNRRKRPRYASLGDRAEADLSAGNDLPRSTETRWRVLLSLAAGLGGAGAPSDGLPEIVPVVGPETYGYLPGSQR